VRKGQKLLKTRIKELRIAIGNYIGLEQPEKTPMEIIAKDFGVSPNSLYRWIYGGNISYKNRKKLIKMEKKYILESKND